MAPSVSRAASTRAESIRTSKAGRHETKQSNRHCMDSVREYTETSEAPRHSEMKSTHETSRTHRGDETSKPHHGDETSKPTTRRAEETSKSTRHGDTSRRAEDTSKSTHHGNSKQETEAERTLVNTNAKAPETYASHIQSMRNPTGSTSRHRSKHTSQLQVPTSALTATSRHSTRRDTSASNASYRYDSEAHTDYPTGRYADSSRVTDFDYPTEISAYEGKSSRYADHSTARPMPESTCLERRGSKHTDSTTLAGPTTTTVTKFPETAKETTKKINKHASKGSKGIDVRVPKGANVVVNVYQAPVVIQEAKKDSKHR